MSTSDEHDDKYAATTGLGFSCISREYYIGRLHLFCFLYFRYYFYALNI